MRKNLEGTYQDGEATGVWKYYHDNGNMASEGRLVNGLKVGQWKFYNRSGRLMEVIEYENGEVKNPPIQQQQQMMRPDPYDDFFF